MPCSPPKLLLLGKDGQLGWELFRSLASVFEVVATGREDVDLADVGRLRACVRRIRPTIIVNAAAYTAVDKAESEPELARAVNAVAPAVLAEESSRLHIPLVHFSTDYVFDGRKSIPYTENDPPNPTSVYGETKLAGEEAVRHSNPRHLIFRLSWLYGTRGSNFFLTMLRFAWAGRRPSVVDDQIGSPTSSRPVAEAVASVVHDVWLTEPECWGTYHLSAAGRTSWYSFAREIFSEISRLEGGEQVSPLAIPTTDYPAAAIRPAFSVLSNKKAAERLGIRMADWRYQLTSVCRRHFGPDGQ